MGTYAFDYVSELSVAIVLKRYLQGVQGGLVSRSLLIILRAPRFPCFTLHFGQIREQTVALVPGEEAKVCLARIV